MLSHKLTLQFELPVELNTELRLTVIKKSPPLRCLFEALEVLYIHKYKSNLRIFCENNWSAQKFSSLCGEFTHTSRTKGYICKLCGSWALNCAIVPNQWNQTYLMFLVAQRQLLKPIPKGLNRVIKLQNPGVSPIFEWHLNQHEVEMY